MDALLFLITFLVTFYVTSIFTSVLITKRVTWTQALIWPYYFCSDVFGDGYKKRPL